MTSAALKDPAHLLDLVAAIQTSVQDVISEYQAVGAVVHPLDGPTANASGGPFDTPEDMSPKYMHAVHLIEAACEQLCATVVSPALSLVNVRRSTSIIAPRRPDLRSLCILSSI